MRGTRLQPPIQRLEPVQYPAHAHDRVAAFTRPTPMSGAAARLEADPLEAFVRDGNVEVGRLRHHTGISAELRDERVGAKARVLLVDDRGNDETAGGKAAGLDDDARGADHRGDAAFHVLRAAAVETAVELDRVERPRHSDHANRG